MCNFSVAPENRRLRSPTSVFVEQSTVIRATIPILAGANGQFGVRPSGDADNISSTQPQSQRPAAPPRETATPGTGATAGARRPGGPNSQPQPFRFPQGFRFPMNPGQQGQSGGFSFNFQPNAGNGAGGMPDLGAMFGPIGMGIGFLNGMQPPQRDNTAGSNNNVNVNSATPSTSANTAETASTTTSQSGSRNQNNPGSREGNSNNVNISQQVRHELSRAPFDTLLPCYSNLEQRLRSRRRPACINRYLDIPASGDASAVQNKPFNEFFEVCADIVQCSNAIELFKPVIKDVVVNYLMRGRDPKNINHVRTCARTLARHCSEFFSNIMVCEKHLLMLPYILCLACH